MSGFYNIDNLPHTGSEGVPPERQPDLLYPPRLPCSCVCHTGRDVKHIANCQCMRTYGPEPFDRADTERQVREFFKKVPVGDHSCGAGCPCQGDCPEPAEVWTPSEPDEIIAEFSKLLRGPTGDGATKRRAGEKPSWKVDTTHEEHFWSHFHKWKAKDLVDADSGSHPLVHAAWRLLAIAHQDIHGTTTS